MSPSFHPEAEAEFLAAIEYYEDCERGLGVDFAVEVRAAVDRAARHPRAWPVLEDEIRRCRTSRFPYGVVYAEEPDGVCVLAVMHLHRDPDYWKRRK